nr:SLC13 family permease [Salmonella enterica]
MNREPITLTLCLLVFAIVMFVWEKVPLAVTSMIVCVALVITGVLNIKQAFAGFIDTNVILFVAMFIVGGALFETGMANKVGGVITRFAKTEKQLIFTIMVVVGLMSGVLSNTGTAAVLIPVVIGVAAKSGFSRSRLLMPLVFAAALGGNLSLIGAPGNLIAQSALQNIGGGFGFFEYAKIGLPMLICGILYFLTIGYRFLPNNATGGEVGSVGEQRDYSHVPQWKQRLSLVVLIATILGMIFEKKIGVSLAVTGCIGALVLVVSGVLTEKQAYKAIDSQTIFIFGGTLALAKALEMTGAGKLVADYVIGMLGQNSSPFMLLIAVFALSVVMTNFMSNTATTALLVPVSLSIAAGMGADPRAVLMATVIGGSCAYATPIGMPANMMVLSAGGYKFVDYAKAGIPLIIVSTIVSLILLPILFPFHPELTETVLTKEHL